MHLSGTLVNIEQRTGNFDNEQGQRVDYDFALLTIRTDAGDLVPVKVRREDDALLSTLKLFAPVSVVVRVPNKIRFDLHAAATAELAGGKPAVRSAS